MAGGAEDVVLCDVDEDGPDDCEDAERVGALAIGFDGRAGAMVTDRIGVALGFKGGRRGAWTNGPQQRGYGCPFLV